MTVHDVLEMLWDVPIEYRDTASVRVQVIDAERDEPLTQEQHDAFNYNFELLIKYPEEEGQE